MALVIVEPRERHWIVGDEFYRFFFPLGILTACALLHPVDWAVLFVHLLIFPKPAIWVVSEVRRLLRDLIARSRFA
jgi:hypothetical protein